VRIFCGQGSFSDAASALLGAKNIRFSKYLASAWTKGVNFSRFCGDVLYGWPLTKGFYSTNIITLGDEEILIIRGDLDIS